MSPVLFHLGPLPVYSFGMMIGLGLLLSLFLMTRRAKKTGFPANPSDVHDLVFVTVLAGFLGARLYYIFQNSGFYFRHPLHVFSLWEGGLVFYGGVIGSLVGLFGFMRIRNIPYLKGLDFMIPFESLTHGMGRVGCFLNGCCYGKPCDLPWAVPLQDAPYRVHPVQLYEALFDFSFFVFLYCFYPRKKFDGQVIALYFIGYSFARFVIEVFREGNAMIGPLTHNQWVSVMLLAGGIVIYLVCHRRKESFKPLS